MRVPRGVHAAVPLQLSLSHRYSRGVLDLEEGASLVFVEGCTDPGGAGGERRSDLLARVGRGARLTGASVQAWPPGTISAAIKEFVVDEGGSATWTDANLGAARIEKTLRARLAAGASADVLCGGYAAAGQAQALTVEAPGGTILAAGGAIETRAERVVRREPLTAVQRLYLASRGLDDAAAAALAVHAFLEPLARRLPLEFSVELTRLLDVELDS